MARFNARQQLRMRTGVPIRRKKYQSVAQAENQMIKFARRQQNMKNYSSYYNIPVKSIKQEVAKQIHMNATPKYLDYVTDAFVTTATIGNPVTVQGTLDINQPSLTSYSSFTFHPALFYRFIQSGQGDHQRLYNKVHIRFVEYTFKYHRTPLVGTNNYGVDPFMRMIKGRPDSVNTSTFPSLTNITETYSSNAAYIQAVPPGNVWPKDTAPSNFDTNVLVAPLYIGTHMTSMTDPSRYKQSSDSYVNMSRGSPTATNADYFVKGIIPINKYLTFASPNDQTTCESPDLIQPFDFITWIFQTVGNQAGQAFDSFQFCARLHFDDN